MFKLETAPLTLSGIYKNGWELYKASIFNVLLWSFILAIIHILPLLYNYVGFYRISPDNSFHFSFVAFFVFLVLLVVESFFIILLLQGMYTTGTEQRVDYPATFSLARILLLNVYAGNIVYFALVNVGMLLFVIPAVFVAVIFVMYLPFLIFDKVSIYNAFSGSARLVWGSWWQTFFALFIPYALLYLVRNIGKVSPNGNQWLYLFDLIMLTIVVPYIYAIIIVQYNNLKIIKSLPEAISQRPRTQS